MLSRRLSLLATTTTLHYYGTVVQGFISSSHKLVRPASSLASLSVQDVFQAAQEELEDEKVPEPFESTINLMAAALDLPWDSGYRDVRRCLGDNNNPLAHRQLTSAEIDNLRQLLDRRKQHEPIQYILGQWDFMEYVIQIQPPLLCPRPETEELVRLILEDEEANVNRRLRILDVGCGTGCIGIALADKLPRATVVAIDIEPMAVQVAQQNAQRILGPNASDRYQTKLVSAQDYSPDQAFDIIVSNPPYIPSADMKSLDRVVLDYESPSALDGGTDGLDVIRTILDQITRSWGGDGCVCWMETDPSHPKLLKDMLLLSTTLFYEQGIHDVFGKQRFVKIRHRKQ